VAQPHEPGPVVWIPPDPKEQLKRDTDIVWLIGQDVDLKRMGRDWRGPCPLHQGSNRTSLSVSPELGLWNCFTCDDGGDVFRWIMRYHDVDVDLPEAVKWLCGLLGQPMAEREERRRARRSLRSCRTIKYGCAGTAPNC
jgi:DNA primase